MGTKIIFLKFLCLFSVIGAQCGEKHLKNGQYYWGPNFRNALNEVETKIESGSPSEESKRYMYSVHPDIDLFPHDFFDSGPIQPSHPNFKKNLPYEKRKSKQRFREGDSMYEKKSRTVQEQPDASTATGKDPGVLDALDREHTLAKSKGGHKKSFVDQKNLMSRVEIVLETFDAGPALLTETIYKNYPKLSCPDRRKCETCLHSQGVRPATIPESPEDVTTEWVDIHVPPPVTSDNYFEEADKANRQTPNEEDVPDVHNVDATSNASDPIGHDSNRDVENFFLNFLYGLRPSGKPQFQSEKTIF